jgi:uncharacterized protein (DUF2225 family)
MAGDDKELKISFIAKKEYNCPVCGEFFRKEELLTGGGRLIAGTLTEELHRLYEPSLKYGDVFPLVYQMIVCPVCWFASMETDFSLLPDSRASDAYGDREKRKADTLLIFPHADFTQMRTLMEGAASYYLTLRCYDYYEVRNSPTIKQGIASIRAAWLLDEMNVKYPGQHYDWLAMLFRRKAEYFYNEALAREQNGSENMSGIKIFGPDTDKNYAYEGMLYMCAYLRYKYGSAQSPAQRKESLESARRTIAKLFGMGRMSKDKPGAFLELARKVYETINKELTVPEAQ